MEPERQLPHSVAVGLALLVTVLWSSSWVLIRWGLDGEDLDPIGFAALRYGLAALLLVAWTFSRRTLRRSVMTMGRTTIGQMVILGIVFYALTQGAQFVAIDNQPAATTSLVLSLSPLVVAWLAGFSLGEVSSRGQWSGAVLVAIGAVAYFAGDLGATAIGMAAAAVALGSNVASGLLGRMVNRDGATPSLTVTALSMSVGAAVLFIVALLVEGIPSVSARAWLIILWLAAVNTALAFTLWNVSMRQLSAMQSSGINNTMLVQIALLAWLLLDEAPGPLALAGVLLVSLGVYMMQFAPPDQVEAPG